jgi:thiol:disulfide interchange protein
MQETRFGTAMNRLRMGLVMFAGLALVLACLAGTITAMANQQDGIDGLLPSFDPSSIQRPNDFEQGEDLLNASAPKATVAATALFTKATEDQPAYLVITAEIAPDWHIYSITQESGGPLATKIDLDNKQKQFKLTGKFIPSPKAESHLDEEAFPGIPLEEHHERVTWFAPIEFAAGVDPAKLKISGAVDAQACHPERGCIPPKPYKFTATQGELPNGVKIPKPGDDKAGDDQKDGASGLFQPKRSKLVIEGQLKPGSVKPGQTAQLVFTTIPQDGFHLYPYADRDETLDSKATLFVVTESSGLTVSRAKPDSSPVEIPSGLNPDKASLGYHTPVRWTLDVTVPEDAKSGDYKLGGMIGFQTCNKICMPPEGASFHVTLNVESTDAAGSDAAAHNEPRPLDFAPVAYSQVAEQAAELYPAPLAFDPEKVSARNSALQASMPIWQALMLAFAGGLILNLMPCVLPVIGLKVLAFVDQAGESRHRVFLLNLWYSLGLLAVFWLLAALAVLFNLGWGGLFRFQAFNIVMISVVFSMALSFLGVWEIPIPGFVGGQKAHKLGEKEGALGAMAKGAITTILATPCTAPFLGTALAWTLKQPPALVFATFTVIGLGMASPYLVIGAFPALIRFLPKPGAWMDTFKQLMGFLLLGTVVFILSYMATPLVIPTVAFLFGLWLAFWWIGRTSLTADLATKLKAWGQGAVLAAIVWVVAYPGVDDVASGRFAFSGLRDVMEYRHNEAIELHFAQQGIVAQAEAKPKEKNDSTLDWEPFTRARFEELVKSGKTVMVDFTANWCGNCKVLESQLLNQPDTKREVERQGIVTLKADYSLYEKSVDVHEMLQILGHEFLPLLAIFPAGRPNEPIIYSGMYTHADLFDALEDAGPSLQAKNTMKTSTTAVRDE